VWTLLNLRADNPPVAVVDQPRRKRWSASVLVSAIAHISVLLVLCWPALPVFVQPRFIVRGEGGTATPVAVALYLPADTPIVSQTRRPLLSLPVAARERKKTKVLPQKRTNLLELQNKAKAAEAGSKHGSEFDGTVFGDEVVPALVQTFPDPKVPRGDIPSGVQGDVVVEITIDVQGNVVEEKLLRGLGYGIDEKVIAAVRGWHFRPATRNGVPIPSKHDVLYHFPS
jgi:TonB family protein